MVGEQAVEVGGSAAAWQDCRPATFEWSDVENAGRLYAAGGASPSRIYAWDASSETCALEVFPPPPTPPAASCPSKAMHRPDCIYAENSRLRLVFSGGSRGLRQSHASTACIFSEESGPGIVFFTGGQQRFAAPPHVKYPGFGTWHVHFHHLDAALQERQ